VSQLSQIHLRQARSFMRSGDAPRAVELLEKARALARNDKAMLRDVTTALAEAYSMLGDHERAARCREQLQHYTAAVQEESFSAVAGAGVSDAGVGSPPPPLPPGSRGDSRGSVSISGKRPGLSKAMWAIIIIAFLGGHVSIYLGYRHIKARHDAEAAAAAAALQEAEVSPPAPAPATAPVLPATAPVAAPTTVQLVSIRTPLSDLVNQNVALLVVMGHYEGQIGGRHLQVDLPLGSGTAFVVTKQGTILTNKHVTAAASDPRVPKSLQDFSLPTLTLRSTSYLACFGPRGDQHIVAQLRYESDHYDFAVLDTHKLFETPLKLAAHGPKLGDEVVAAGFPGAVQNIFDRQFVTEDRVRAAMQQLIGNGQIDLMAELFSPESFKATVTYGHISTAERNLQEVAHTQFDAKIGPGNSGGPLLNSQNSEVVAIVTSGGMGDATGYNFGLLLDQFRDELIPYVPGF
jgi:S1-C subfamily serine protease